MKALLLGLVAFGALTLVLPLLVLSVVASMPWLAGGVTTAAGPALVLQVPHADIATTPAGPVTVPVGNFSPVDRFRLALAVGFSPAEAVIATAISIAENGAGNPATISAPNHDAARSVDIGLWQINSGHAAEFGGIQALQDPLTNARAARVLYLRGGWFPWCTYPGGCGGLPGAANWSQALAMATAASLTAGQ